MGQASGIAIILLVVFGFVATPSYGQIQALDAMPAATETKKEMLPIEQYKKADWVSALNTMIKFNALDLSADEVVDEYAMITECELYFRNYTDDFKWQKIRAALRQSVAQRKNDFYTAYYYDTQMQLDRYDFEKQIFKFTDKSSVSRANVFELYGVSGQPCQRGEVKYLSRKFRAVLNEPVTMQGLPLIEKHAQNLLRLMQADNNVSRVLYARFYLRILYIDPFAPIHDTSNKTFLGYGQSGVKGDTVRFDAQLDAIEFYEDDKMTKLVYTFKPG